MWDLDTIKKINSPARAARVYDIGNGKFALGKRGTKALYVVRRLLARGDGRGRPRYAGVRGVRPFIGPEARAIKPSSLLRNVLTSALI